MEFLLLGINFVFLSIKKRKKKDVGGDEKLVFLLGLMNEIKRNKLKYFMQFQAKSIAQQMADRIHAKLNYTKTEEKSETEEQTETLKRYELELEINDFPQTCRWRVTSKVSFLCSLLFQEL